MTDRMDRDEQDRTAREQAPRATGGERLVRLEDLDDFEIADGQPDIRGWTVRTTTDGEVGKVESLIVDPAAREVRYLDVKVMHELLGTEQDESVLIPIGAARLNDDDDVVMIDRLPATGLRGAPRFGREAFTPEHDRTLGSYYGRESSREAADRERFYGKRRQEGRGEQR